ncbi:MAG TPA: hypothetical protein VK933_01990 [Longimicrobiales bacterium]|nr:hypothetical protein [Longimicrobiales bacterium]
MTSLPLPLVTADELPDDVRRILDPGSTLYDQHGRPHTLPGAFLRIDSWQQAMETELTPHFMLWELIGVDVRETGKLRGFPRYVPCALLMLATALELFRLEAGSYVHIAANGGYRSPGHALSRHASRHCWGTAANIYRVGDTYLDSRSEIDKYAAMARRVLPGVWIRPYGMEDGEADDHLHIDLGYTVFDPFMQDDRADT